MSNQPWGSYAPNSQGNGQQPPQDPYQDQQGSDPYSQQSPYPQQPWDPQYGQQGQAPYDPQYGPQGQQGQAPYDPQQGQYGQPGPYQQGPYSQQPYPQQGQYGQQGPYGGQQGPYQGYQVDPYGQNPYAAFAGSGAGRPRPSVGFVQAIRLYFKNYAVFSGRASRSEYWWVTLFNGLIGIVFMVIFMAAGGATALLAENESYGTSTTTASTSLGAGLIFLLVLYGIYGLANIVPSLAITWRRLHDTDKSGAFYFLGYIPYVGSIILIILLALAPVPTAWQRWDNGRLPVEN